MTTQHGAGAHYHIEKVLVEAFGLRCEWHDQYHYTVLAASSQKSYARWGGSTDLGHGLWSMLSALQSSAIVVQVLPGVKFCKGS